MAVYACNAGFTELAKLGAGETASAWTHIALATVPGQDASDTALAQIFASASGAEIDVSNSANYTRFSGILFG